MENIPKYVINLKRRNDRLQKFYEIIPFSKENINIVYGFDGKNYFNESEEELMIYNNLLPGISLFTGENLLPGEKGCFISHIRIFKDIIKHNIPFAIVFEDDIILCEDFKNKLEIIINEMPQNTQILYFGGRLNPDFRMEEHTCTKITENIVAHNKINWIYRDWNNHDRCTFGYIISNTLAKTFIKYFENNVDINVPLDHWMIRLCMDNQIPIYNSYPLLSYSHGNSSDSDIRCSYNTLVYVYTFYTDETRVQYLKDSAIFNNFEVCYLKKNTWNGYVDKIIVIYNILQKHNDNDIICFIDAYDVLINQNIDYLLEKFNYYNCDLLIGAELSCYPDIYKEMYPKTNSKYKYVNSGGYIGYKHAIQKMFKWKSYDDIYQICSYGGDQSYFIAYFISHNSDKIKLDTECLIFQNMHWVNWNELQFNCGKLYNTILHTYPCFIHFNGGTWQQNNGENIMPIFIDKMKTTLINKTTDNLYAYSQIITSTCYPHPQI
jgi:GR25 family glycosyltransferase involved in LPS biosynthesis